MKLLTEYKDKITEYKSDQVLPCGCGLNLLS